MFKYIVTSIFIILIGVCWYLGYQLKATQTKLNNTIAQYEQQLKERPREIIVKETKVEYKYKDGKTIVKYVPREGSVNFNVAKYDALVAREDSLKAVQATLNAKLTNTLNEKLAAVKDKVIQENLAKDYREALADVDAELAKVQAQLNKPEIYVKIKNKGFTLRPMVGAGYNGSLSPYIGIKGAYWNRYGLSIGTTDKQVGIGISRHIDDIIPFLNNTEALILIGYPYKSTDGKVFAGISVGL